MWSNNQSPFILSAIRAVANIVIGRRWLLTGTHFAIGILQLLLAYLLNLGGVFGLRAFLAATADNTGNDAKSQRKPGKSTFHRRFLNKELINESVMAVAATHHSPEYPRLPKRRHRHFR
jgi:hypothetical protein